MEQTPHEQDRDVFVRNRHHPAGGEKTHKNSVKAVRQNPSTSTASPWLTCCATTLILGTPSYGEGDLPGKAWAFLEPNWEEFSPKGRPRDFSGKRIAFWPGAQERYADRFASPLRPLVDKFRAWGAEVVGDWPLDGYRYDYSAAEVDGRFLGPLSTSARKACSPMNASTPGWRYPAAARALTETAHELAAHLPARR